jgi:mannose-6-phosphate isomerase-like protein (cupin superfamily)
MTTYNGEKYVETQMQSLLSQSAKPDEVIIFDDCSVDRTADNVRAFFASHGLTNWTLHVNPDNLGFVPNFHQYHVTCYRPWGSYTVLEEGVFYKIKRLTVQPGKRLSYQMHYHRHEHWIVVHGTASILIDDEEHLITSGQSTYIPIGAKHRLENPGKVLLEVIEVQIGSYREEDDIIRFDDDFERC